MLEKVVIPIGCEPFDLLALTIALSESSDLHLSGPDTPHYLDILSSSDVMQWLSMLSFNYTEIIDRLSEELRKKRQELSPFQKLYASLLDINAWIEPRIIDPKIPDGRETVEKIRKLSTRASAYAHQSRRLADPDKKTKAVNHHIADIKVLATTLRVAPEELKWITPHTLMRIAAHCTQVLKTNNSHP